LSTDTTTQQPEETSGVHVVVTTAHRGVFFGQLDGPRDGKTVRLHGAQMCVSWSADVQGVLGLASSGPSRSCRVTRAVPGITTLQDITAVMDATGKAVDAWQDRPWS
jgi:hypothetical protein